MKEIDVVIGAPQAQLRLGHSTVHPGQQPQKATHLGGVIRRGREEERGPPRIRRRKDDLRQLNGAEDPEYDAAGLSYGAKDDRFAVVAELRQVLGMTRDLYDLAAPFLTVYSNRSGVNVDLSMGSEKLSCTVRKLRATTPPSVGFIDTIAGAPRDPAHGSGCAGPGMSWRPE